MIEITDDEIRATGLSEKELRGEIALLLYTKGVGSSLCARMAQMDRVSFQKFHAGRGIPVHYGVKDFEDDIETLRGMGELD